MLLSMLSRVNHLPLLVLLAVSSMGILTACNSKKNQDALAGEEAGKMMTTSSYNYTGHNLYDISFKDAAVPFDVAGAARAGSVFLRNSDSALLDDGGKYHFSFSDCCFMWDKRLPAPTKLRVVWSVVFDLDLFEGESGRAYDDRASRSPAPGSRWCTAVVEVIGPVPTTADNFSLHFLNDGTVVGNYGRAQAPMPLSITQLNKHAEAMPKRQYCRQETTNPWFGIPRTPHRE